MNWHAMPKTKYAINLKAFIEHTDPRFQIILNVVGAASAANCFRLTECLLPQITPLTPNNLNQFVRFALFAAKAAPTFTVAPDQNKTKAFASVFSRISPQ